MNAYNPDPDAFDIYDQDEPPELCAYCGVEHDSREHTREPHYDADAGDRYGPETSAQLSRQRERALMSEQFLLWEHELAQPSYYDYFLEEVTR